MPDPRDERAAGTTGQARERRIPGVPVPARHPYLDQFVVVKGARRLGDDGVRNAGVAHLDHGLQGVGEAAKVAALFFFKFHDTDSNRPRRGLPALETGGTIPIEPFRIGRVRSMWRQRDTDHGGLLAAGRGMV